VSRCFGFVAQPTCCTTNAQQIEVVEFGLWTTTGWHNVGGTPPFQQPVAIKQKTHLSEFSVAASLSAIGFSMQRQRRHDIKYLRRSLVMWLAPNNALVSINEVALRRARLLPECVTACLLTGKPSEYVPSHLGQLNLLSLLGRIIGYQPVWLGLSGVRSLVTGGR